MRPTFWILLLSLILPLQACNLPRPAPQGEEETPTPTIIASPSPAPSLTPLPSPTASPAPAARLSEAEAALQNGDYAQAREEYRFALNASAEEEVRQEALWGLGRVEFAEANYASALEPLRSLSKTSPATLQSTRAWFLLAETYFALQRYPESADAYLQYLNARPDILDAYIHERRGDAFTQSRDYSNALNAYQSALNAEGQTHPLGIRIKIGNTYLGAGQPEQALEIYAQLDVEASDDYTRAALDYLSGKALLALNRPEDGYGRWRHAVDAYPLAYDSYAALLGLVDAGQTVDEFNRGLVDYFAGQHAVAVAAFDRYLSQNPSHDGTALHYKALSLREMGEYEASLALWNELIENYPGSRFWEAAWDERSYTQWVYLGEYIPAAESLQQFVRDYSGSPLAATYLMQAARLYERAGELEPAASLWETLPNQYPTDGQTAEALFQAGITRYRLGDYPKASQNFQNALPLAADSQARARTLLWVGKTYAAAGDSASAHSAWQQAQAIDATEYYSIRARDLLENRAPFAAPPSWNLAIDLPAERRAAAAWLRVQFDLPPETDLENPGALAEDPAFQRGMEWWQMGFYNEARAEFETLREATSGSAADSFRLGNALLDAGAYRTAIFALRQVLTLAGMDEHTESLNAPAYFKHARYGFYYQDLIFPAAQENELDPVFITSLIRQESLFEGFVRSSAGARGLMQIIPATGESLAEQTGYFPNYTPELLYSPYVSIRLGTYYLRANLRGLDNDPYAALAAYNAGPGNAAIWQSLAGQDADLLLEVIRYAETRNYIRHIYETYTIYRGIYSPMQ